MSLVAAFLEFRSAAAPRGATSQVLSAWVHERAKRPVRNHRGHWVDIPSARRFDTAQEVLVKLWVRRADVPPDSTLLAGEATAERYVESMLANAYLDLRRRDLRQGGGERDGGSTGDGPSGGTGHGGTASDIDGESLRVLIDKLLPHAVEARRPQNRPALEASAKDCLEMLELGGGVAALLHRRGVIDDRTPPGVVKTQRNKVYQQQHRLKEALQQVAGELRDRGDLDDRAMHLLDQIVPEADSSCQPGRARGVPRNE